MCGVLFGLLYRLLCTGTQGHHTNVGKQTFAVLTPLSLYKTVVSLDF